MQEFIISGILLSTPLLLAAIGDLYAEKSGVLNLGLEATMIMGAYFSYHFAIFYGNVYVGLLAAVIVGLLMGLLNSLFMVTLRCSQVIYGVALNLLALGFTSTIFRLFFDPSEGYIRSPGLPRIVFPAIQDIPILGAVISNQTILTYIGFAFLVITVIVFRYTEAGIKIKAVGENPYAADSLGVNVHLVRYTSLLISGVFTALGGASLTIGVLHYFQEGMTAGRGFVALAAIIFGRYTPLGLVFGALLFGMTNALQLRMQVLDVVVPYQIFLTLPYVVTILAMYIVGPSAAPRYLTKPFVRGGRH